MFSNEALENRAPRFMERAGFHVQLITRASPASEEPEDAEFDESLQIAGGGGLGDLGEGCVCPGVHAAFEPLRPFLEHSPNHF